MNQEKVGDFIRELRVKECPITNINSINHLNRLNYNHYLP